MTLVVIDLWECFWYHFARLQSRCHSHLWLKCYFSTFLYWEIISHPSKHFCTKIYTQSPMKMVRKFDVRPLNLHGLSGRGFVFKNVFKTLIKGLYYKNYNISYLLSIVIFTPPTLHLEKGKHV